MVIQDMNARQWLIFIPVLVKLFLAFTLELSVDESHYLNYGRWVDWSYFDHPPMVGWVQYVFSFFNLGHWTARLPAILIGAILFWDVHRWLDQRYQNPQMAFWVVLGLQFSPILFAMTFLFIPETVLLLFSWMVFRSVDQLEKPMPERILALGFWAGLAGLSKYTAILLMPSLVWEFLNRRWHQERSAWWGVLGALFLGLVMISPVILWNWQRDWISFSYQTSHVIQSGFSWAHLATSLAGVLIGYSVFLVPWLVVLAKAPKSGTDGWAARFILIPAGFFLYAATTDPILPHWPALIFLVGLTVSMAKSWSLYPQTRVWIQRSVVLTVLMTAGLLTQFYVPVKGMELASRDIAGWESTRERLLILSQDLKYGGVRGLISTHWTFASRAVVYFNDFLPVHLLDERKDQYDFWLKPPEGHQSYFVLYNTLEERELKSLIRCGELSLIEEVPAQVYGAEIFRFQIWLCKKYLPQNEF